MNSTGVARISAGVGCAAAVLAGRSWMARGAHAVIVRLRDVGSWLALLQRSVRAEMARLYSRPFGRVVLDVTMADDSQIGASAGSFAGQIAGVRYSGSIQSNGSAGNPHRRL